MALRLQGVATPERVASALGIDGGDATDRLGKLAADDLAKERTGKLAGFSLTEAGVARFGELLADEGLRGSDALGDCYDRFLMLDGRVKKVCTDFQVRPDGTPNDHKDTFYDGEVLQRLYELHDRARTCLDKIAEVTPRYAIYAARLDAVVERLRGGDRAAMNAPLAESYHTIWFELHKDLMWTLGREE
jgi:hypothetical protein